MSLTEPFIRLLVMTVATLCILAFMMLSPDKRIPFINMAGRNSLSIYVFHRIFAFWYYKSEYVIDLRIRYQILGALVLTVIISAVFGSDLFSNWFDKFVRGCGDALCPHGSAASDVSVGHRAVAYILLIFFLTAPLTAKVIEMFN